jgi:hypothetical protein
MSELLIWRRVPAGSKLEVAVGPADGQFTTTGQVFRFSASNPPDEDWSDEELRPGPKRLRLKGSTNYIVDILVAFVGTTRMTATARATVLKPDGSTFGKPQSVELKGKNGDPPDTLSIVLLTLRDDRGATA